MIRFFEYGTAAAVWASAITLFVGLDRATTVWQQIGLIGLMLATFTAFTITAIATQDKTGE